MANETLRELYSININEELPITLEKHMQEKEISIGEEKWCFRFLQWYNYT